MLIIPINQTTSGIGNTVMAGSKVLPSTIRSLHLCYLNADGTLYNGAHTADISIMVSNERVLAAGDIRYPVQTFNPKLDAASPMQVIDVNGTYRNIVIRINSITEGSVTAFHFPELADGSWS